MQLPTNGQWERDGIVRKGKEGKMAGKEPHDFCLQMTVTKLVHFRSGPSGKELAQRALFYQSVAKERRRERARYK